MIPNSHKMLKDIATNMVWLHPICVACPDKIPSGFFLCDVLLRLDYLLEGKLLMVTKPDNYKGREPWTTYEEKVELARQETGRLKRLLGALRYLWRNGPL